MIRLCWVGRFVFLSSGVEIRARFIVLCYLWTDTIGVFVFGLWARGGVGEHCAVLVQVLV